MLEILYKDRHVLAVIKPAGIPSQPDPSGAPDAMSLARAALAEQGEPGYLWLVHRLDRVVGGILVFARTKAAAGELLSDVRLQDTYTAEGVSTVTLRFSFISKDRTLTKQELSPLVEAISASLAKLSMKAN